MRFKLFCFHDWQSVEQDFNLVSYINKKYTSLFNEPCYLSLLTIKDDEMAMALRKNYDEVCLKCGKVKLGTTKEDVDRMLNERYEEHRRKVERKIKAKQLIRGQ
jgi:hypothetical protein